MNHIGPWTNTLWDDGNEQWQCRSTRFAVERVPFHPTRDKWHVVDRGVDDEHAWNTTPPACSGPYDDLEAAKAALLVTISSHEGDK